MLTLPTSGKIHTKTSRNQNKRVTHVGRDLLALLKARLTPNSDQVFL